MRHCRWSGWHMRVLSCVSPVRLRVIPWTAAARLLCPRDSPGRTLERGAIHSSRGSSQPRDWTQVSYIAGGLFTIWATREAHFSHLKVNSLIICTSFIYIFFEKVLQNDRCVWRLFHWIFHFWKYVSSTILVGTRVTKYWALQWIMW